MISLIWSLVLLNVVGKDLTRVCGFSFWGKLEWYFTIHFSLSKGISLSFDHFSLIYPFRGKPFAFPVALMSLIKFSWENTSIHCVKSNFFPGLLIARLFTLYIQKAVHITVAALPSLSLPLLPGVPLMELT